MLDRAANFRCPAWGARNISSRIGAERSAAALSSQGVAKATSSAPTNHAKVPSIGMKASATRSGAVQAGKPLKDYAITT